PIRRTCWFRMFASARRGPHFPAPASQEKIGACFVEPKALVLAHDPGLQLLVDVVSQSDQGRGTEATVVTDPPAKERIDLLSDFSQRPRRLPGNVQAPDRCPNGLERSGTDRWGVPTEELGPL